MTHSAAGMTSAEAIGAGGKGKAQTLKLAVTKPLDFEFVAGAYAFLKVPDVSLDEWHPFTIASAPEDEHLILYCKAVGDWTRATLELFCPPAKPADGAARAERGFPEVRVFGPHGASVQSAPLFLCALRRDWRGRHPLPLDPALARDARERVPL